MLVILNWGSKIQNSTKKKKIQKIIPHTHGDSLTQIQWNSISKHYKHTLTVKEREKERAEKPDQAVAEGRPCGYRRHQAVAD